MKKYKLCSIIIALLLCSLARLYGQGENNIWTFGHGFSLDFNYTPALLKDTVYWNGQSNRAAPPDNVTFSYYRSTAVCDADGNLLFMVKFFDSQLHPNAPNIFDRNENPIAGTNFLNTISAEVALKIPTIVPHPGNPNQYYIFYARNSGLLYSLFDITLNNGLGDIVPGQHNILVSNYNTVLGGMMTTVQGCEGVWLIVRHNVYNQYLSFKIDIHGLNTTPVVSEAGIMFTLGDKNFNNYSELVASPDGKMLATASPVNNIWNFPGGVELYDFEKCSGKVKNAMIFDVGNDNYGVGFSPNSSKLYVESNLPTTYPNQPYTQTDHNLYQFDLSLPDLSAIESSKTLILSNPVIQREGPFCPNMIPALSTIRIGPDKKLYLLNNAPQVCSGTSGVGLAFHVINFPDLPGIACSPTLNAIYNVQNGMSNGLNRTENLPREIVLAPMAAIDTLINPAKDWSVCFKDQDTLKALSQATCIEWSTGATDSFIVVTDNDKYWVRYFKDCQLHVDTFNVSFYKMPDIELVQYGCPGFIMLKTGSRTGPTFKLDLFNSRGGKIYGGNALALHEVYNLDEGIYDLKIGAGPGCDTTIQVQLKSYPVPDVTVSPPSAKITFGEAIELSADGAVHYTWEPAASLNSRTDKVVRASPEVTTEYTIVGINAYGCRDTATVSVIVTFDKQIKMPNAFTPNGDGLNDQLKIPGGRYKVLRFEVYNRYGQSVFAEAGSSDGWDGTFNGNACDAGVYYYAIRLSMPDNTQLNLKGEVHLIR